MGRRMSVSAYKIKDYVYDLQKRGISTFTLSEIRENFQSFSDTAIKSALRRISGNNAIMSVRNGFYSIIPVGYALRGTVPSEFYIDNLMKHLNRPYYVGLLNAAAYYGAAHQQSQVFSVITSFPPLRDAAKKGVHINFISTRREIPQTWLKPIRAENGDIQASTPELTAADLITHQKEIGGLNRASTILYELAEALNFERLDKPFFDFVPFATIQRLGYMLEHVLEQPKLADALYAKALAHGCQFQKIPLKRGKKKNTFAVDARWKIIINEQIEMDD
jgi:hypothetical protein